MDRDVRGQHAPDGGVVPRGLLRRGADLREGLRTTVGHEGQQKCDGDAQRLKQVIQHRSQARALALVLGEDPGGRLVDILIGAGDDLEHLDERLLGAEVIHIAGIRLAQRGRHGDELIIERIVLALGRERAAEVLDDHGDGAAQEVAEVVGEVGVDAGDEQLVGEIAVTAERELAQEVVTQRVHTVALGEHDGVDDVALRLRHLAAAEQQPAVAEDLLRQGHAHAHEHGRPDDGVEAHDLLADHVHVGGPVLVIIVVLVVQEAEGRAVVEQRIDPDIDDVAGVKIDRDAPREARARHAQIFQAGVDEVFDHLVDAAGRLEERAAEQQLAHGLGILRQAEEVRLLLGIVHLAAAVRALAVDELALGPEALARRAVHAGILALIDIALVVHLLEDALHGLDMIVVRRADEAVVGDVHQLPQRAHAAGAFDDVVHELLGRDAGSLGLLLDLLAVLVRAGQEHDVIAAHALVARDRIGRNRAVGVADVQFVRRVINWGRDIKLSFAHTAFSSVLVFTGVTGVVDGRIGGRLRLRRGCGRRGRRGAGRRRRLRRGVV